MRSGETLSRIGKMAELFDDFSPLQLMASGVFDGKPFTLIGRLQYQYAQGTWTEWVAFFDDGSTAFLSEDNGAYVFTQPFDAGRAMPAADQLRLGATTAINGTPFTVASNQPVSLLSAQGELPHLPPLGASFAMVELRNANGEVLSVDYGPGVQTASAAPVLSLGRAVVLDDLKLRGLKDESAKEEKATAFNCPNCGAPIEVTLATSQSITCRACNSLIDLSKGTGGALKHAMQDEPVTPLIALGTVGTLQATDWQVVGFQHRMGKETGDDEESFGWDEYLLYHRSKGFTFLVDAEDGWSLVKPLTGSPVFKPGGETAVWQGAVYKVQSSYNAETSYVAGEFYWRVQRGQKTFNRDFTSGALLLSQEMAGREITWSGGSKLDGALVARAFKLEGKKELFKRSDASPLSSGSRMGCSTIVIVILLILLFLFVMTRCSRCDPAVQNCSSSSSTRTSGGSFGGFSGGGGHK